MFLKAFYVLFKVAKSNNQIQADGALLFYDNFKYFSRK